MAYDWSELLLATMLTGGIFASTVLVAAPAPRIEVLNQAAVGSEVTIGDASLPVDGFLAIHASDAKGGVAAKTIGHVALTAGDHKSVKIRLTAPFKAGDKLWAVLHEDTGKKGTFEFGMSGKNKVDQPLKVSNKAVEMPFTLQ